MTTVFKRQLMYPDFNSVPWPLNHRAYIRAVADALRTDLPATAEVDLPHCHQQGRDIRTADIALTGLDQSLDLHWDEYDGWTYTHGRALLHGAAPVLTPEEVTDAVRAVLEGQERPVSIDDQRRRLGATVAPGFERKLAAYRSPVPVA